MRDLARGDGGRQGRGLGPFLFHPCTHPAQLSGTCSDGDTLCSDGNTLAVTVTILVSVFTPFLFLLWFEPHGGRSGNFMITLFCRR